MRSAALERLVDYWQTLTPAALAGLGDIYAGDATFRDPFNDVQGLPAIHRIFEEMFVTLDNPRFTIVETIAQDDSAILIWDFDFRIKALPGQPRRIHGTSHVRFAADGRVAYHRDYWDAAGELYEGLPVIGALMRFLKRRMA